MLHYGRAFALRLARGRQAAKSSIRCTIQLHWITQIWHAVEFRSSNVCLHFTLVSVLAGIGAENGEPSYLKVLKPMVSAVWW